MNGGVLLILVACACVAVPVARFICNWFDL